METPFIAQPILDYCDAHASPLGEIPDSILKTAGHVPGGHMMVGTHVAKLLQVLTLARQPKRVLEIGTFHGFSAAAIAEVLPSASRLICCEKNPEIGLVAARNLASYLAQGKIELLIREGIEYMKTCETQFDLIFIDAEKAAFCYEIELLHQHLVAGGILVVDNAFAGLAVLNDYPKKQWVSDTEQFNRDLGADRRFLVTQLPLRDGITLAVKR